MSRHSVILGVPGSQRVQRFQESLAEACLPPARVLSWVQFLEGASLGALVKRGALVRVESPGQDFESWRAMVACGDGPLSRADAYALEEDFGRIRCGAQWYSGLTYAMTRVAEELLDAPAHLAMSCAPDIALMFDKAACQRHLEDRGVAVPQILPTPKSFEALLTQTEQTPRVFLKPRHGSSASGVMAIERGPRAQLQAWTSVEYTEDGRLYNNLRVRKVRDQKELAAIINGVIAEGVHLERWVPKGGLGGRTVDLRVLCIDGKPRHAVVRSSMTPLTNLHLGNARGNLNDLKNEVGKEGWIAVARLCKQAAGAFPKSLHVALDVVLTPGWNRQVIIEANAFGDLLPGVRSRDEETGLAQINAVLKRA